MQWLNKTLHSDKLLASLPIFHILVNNLKKELVLTFIVTEKKYNEIKNIERFTSIDVNDYVTCSSSDCEQPKKNLLINCDLKDGSSFLCHGKENNGNISVEQNRCLRQFIITKE